jgi:DNA repair exonuclease SbcCD ATPase subunit
MAIEDSTLKFEPMTRLLLGQNQDSSAADDNGAGKSSVAEALRWCLFGETVRGTIDKSLPVTHVIREGGKRIKTSVTLNFQTPDNDVIVTRTRTKTKGELKVSMDHALSGVRSHSTGTEAQESINRLLGINVQQFANLVHLDGSYPYLFAPASDKDRKDILSELVDLAITEHMQQEVRARISPMEAQLSALCDELLRSTVNLDNYRKELPELRKKGVAAKKLIVEKKAKLRVVEGEINTFKARYDELQAESEELAGVYEDKIEDKKQQIKELDDAIEVLWTKKAAISDSYLKSDLETAKKAIYSLQSQRQSIGLRIKQIEKLQAEGKCSTCGQDTTAVSTSELGFLTSQTKGLTSEIEEHKATVEDLESKRRVAIESICDDVARAKKDGDSHTSQLEELERADKAARSGVLEEATKIRRALMSAVADEARLKAEIDGLQKVKQETKERFEATKEEAEICDANIHDLKERDERLQHELDGLRFWKKGFGPKGVASLYIETVLPHISSRIQKYANILTGGDVTVSLQAYTETKSKTIREAIQISAVNSKGASVYGSNSTGERNRINLAVTLGLIEYFRDVNVFESNLLICDEIFDGLDSTGVEQALQALNQANVSSVLVVSHHESLKPLFEETIYARKKGGVTTIVS